MTGSQGLLSIVRAAWLAAVLCTQLLFVLARAQSCPSAQQCRFRVLAIGDSLTKGAVPSKQLNHPYSIRLQQLLNTKFRNRATPNVTVAGERPLNSTVIKPSRRRRCAAAAAASSIESTGSSGPARRCCSVPDSRREIHVCLQQQLDWSYSG
jgi:hypothetical protein